MKKWGALGILMTLAFLNYMDRNLVFPLLGLIGANLHLSVERLGALATGFHLVYACSAPLVGLVSDRMARKAILLVSLVTWSVVTALSGTAMGFVSLLVWRSLTGLGEGGYFPTAVSLIGDLFGPSQRGLALALHGMCTTIGGAVGYGIGGVLGERLGWRAPFLLAVVPGLTLAAVLAVFFREPPRGAFDPAPVRGRPEPASVEASAEPIGPYRAQAGALRPARVRRSYVAIVTSRPVLLMSLAALAGSFAMNGLNAFFPMYLAAVRGVSVSRAGVLTGAFFAMTLVGQLSGGLLSDRTALRGSGGRPALVSLPYLALAPATALIAMSPSTFGALACYGLTQIGRGFAEPSIYGTIIDGTGSHERGAAQGFLLLFTFLGSSLAPFVAAIVIDRAGFTAALLLLAVGAAAAGAVAGALYLVMRTGTDGRAVER